MSTALPDEIEQAIELERGEVERSISRLRLGIVGVMSLGIAGSIASGHMASLLPAFYELALLANALVLFFVLRRTVFVPRALSTWAAVFDLAAGPIFFGLAPAPPPPAGFDIHFNDAWYYLLMPAQIFLFLAVAQLRPSRLTAVLCTVVALAVFWKFLPMRASFHPAMGMTSVFIACAGAIGWYAARRQRRALELFGRLSLLKRYLPPEAVRRVLETRTSLEALALGGQKRAVTIMATDLRGFTSFSEKLAPEEVVSQLNAYHGAMVDQLDRHGGALDKFIGDGALAVFGLVPSADDGASAAVACARSMLVALAELNTRRATLGQPPLRMGIGVHTGEVVAGNIGAPHKRLEFTVIGDAVNTAARLESATKDLGVPAIASLATVERLTDKSSLERLAPVALKGKDAAVEVFAIQ